MMRFFACIRMMLALDRAARSLGELVQQFIRDSIIPQLEEKLGQAKSDVERERTQQLIQDYERYSTRGTSESKLYGEIADRAISGTAHVFHLNSQDEDDLAQAMAQGLITGRWNYHGDVQDVRPLDASFKGFTTLERGPVALGDFWGTMVKNQAMGRVRDIMRRNPDIFNKRELGEERDPFEDLPSGGHTPSEEVMRKEDETNLVELERNLEDFVKKNAKDEIDRALFREWLKAGKKHGGDYGAITMKYEVYPQLMQAYSVPYKTLAYRWENLIKLLRVFLKKERHGSDSIYTQRNRLSFVEVFKQRFAAWVLGE